MFNGFWVKMDKQNKDRLVRMGIFALVMLVTISQGITLVTSRDRADAVVMQPFFFDVNIPQAPEQPKALHASELLVQSIIQIESMGNPRMVGSKGERGLMQIMEGTWGDVTRGIYKEPVSFTMAFNPEVNTQVGKAYLTQLQRVLYTNKSHWNADLRSLLLASYNAGPYRVAKAGYDLRKLPRSTQDYVKRGKALHDALMETQQLELQAMLANSELRSL